MSHDVTHPHRGYGGRSPEDSSLELTGKELRG
jgi:hypothetical protein